VRIAPARNTGTQDDRSYPVTILLTALDTPEDARDSLNVETIGNLIVRTRQARGWSQLRLAALLCAASGNPSVTRHEVSRWERGERIPTRYWLRWLAHVLDIPLDVAIHAAAVTRARRRASRVRETSRLVRKSGSHQIPGPRHQPTCERLASGLTDGRKIVTPSVSPDTLRARVDKALAGFLARQRSDLTAIDPVLSTVAQALEDFVLRGGKRLRPAFAYWGYRGAGGIDTDEVVTSFAALELLHACALIHDDVMDSSDTRRGAPAIHREFADHHRQAGWAGDPEAFGRSAAILLGDLCLAWCDEMFSSAGVDPADLLRARPFFDAMRTEVMAGQYLDVLIQNSREMSMAWASKVARYKSAKYTIERPLLIGGALAGGGQGLLDAYSSYGMSLGEAFQLRDDVLGVFGDPEQTGKPAGDDLREGKRTYLVAAALERADDKQREILDRDLGNADLDAEGVERLRELIMSTGALATVERRIEELSEAALRALDDAPVDPEAAVALRALATAATQRSL